MIPRTTLCCLCLIGMGWISSCASNEAQEVVNEAAPVELMISDPVEISETILTKRASFHRELMANGKLVASRKADLKFRTDGIISQVNVQDGQQVAVGFVLASLDTDHLKPMIDKTALDLQKAKLDYSDELLRAGYRLEDTVKLSVATKTILRLRSGFSAAEVQWRQLQDDIARTKLVAPFSGKVANVKAKAFNNSGTYDYVCTLVDDRELWVDFQVLERELPFIQASKTVFLMPFTADSSHYTGRIVSINPLVDESGMVYVRAVVTNRGKLLDGMNVKIMVQQFLGNQLVVPKEAVLDRQGRKVVFTIQGSMAKWNYVEIDAENSSQYAIKSGLDAGDEVIVNGNFNLAHNRPVKRVSKTENQK